MNRKSHPQGVFIIALYLVFAIFTLALTAVSASVYENITSGMEENHSVRTALSYISTKMRQADDVTVNNGVLEIAEDDCVSRIYFHNGHITEQYTLPSTRVSKISPITTTTFNAKTAGTN